MRDDEELVALYETSDRVQFLALKLALDQADIPCSTINENIGYLYPMGLAFAFKVQVLEGDLPAAQQILRDMGLEP